MYEFEFHRPTTIAEAVEALTVEESYPLAGGQTLLPSMKSRLAAPAALVSLTDISELRGVMAGPGQLRIGAGTTHAQVAREVAGHYPALAWLAGNIGDPAVRNRGTIGGSLANNDPAACYPAGTLGSEAVIHTDRRDIPCDDYFLGLFTTALEEGELLTAVTYQIPDAAHYIKFRQIASGFALVGVFYARYGERVRLAVTGAGERGVFRWSEAEAALQDGGPAALKDVGLPQEPMMSDMHGGADYRKAVVAELARRCAEAAERSDKS